MDAYGWAFIWLTVIAIAVVTLAIAASMALGSVVTSVAAGLQVLP